MISKKYLSIFLIAMAFSTQGASASTLMPSLYSQMQYQKEIDKEVQVSRINANNDARLAEIKAKNQARMRAIAAENAMATASENEKILDAAARNAALSRPVYRNPINTASTALTPQFQSAATNITISRDNSSINLSSRNQGNIDMRKIEQAWLEWVNSLRAENGLAPYSVNEKLNKTAQEWSEFSRDRGYTTHGRPGDGCVGATNYVCYNFSVIDQWFKDRGVNPSIINRSKHTENVGYGSFRCNSSDCTQAAINAIKKTYNFFYSEKSYNGVHYRSMVHPSFKYMGLGFAEKNGTYYLTIHYSNELQ